jgi:hypothetical protein
MSYLKITPAIQYDHDFKGEVKIGPFSFCEVLQARFKTEVYSLLFVVRWNHNRQGDLLSSYSESFRKRFLGSLSSQKVLFVVS